MIHKNLDLDTYRVASSPSFHRRVYPRQLINLSLSLLLARAAAERREFAHA
jgi:hypothetical protein